MKSSTLCTCHLNKWLESRDREILERKKKKSLRGDNQRLYIL